MGGMGPSTMGSASCGGGMGGMAPSTNGSASCGGGMGGIAPPSSVGTPASGCGGGMGGIASASMVVTPLPSKLTVLSQPARATVPTNTADFKTRITGGVLGFGVSAIPHSTRKVRLFGAELISKVLINNNDLALFRCRFSKEHRFDFPSQEMVNQSTNILIQVGRVGLLDQFRS